MSASHEYEFQTAQYMDVETNPLVEGTPGVDTYDLRPEELRRALEVLQSDPMSVLVLVGDGGVSTYHLMHAIELALPGLRHVVYEANLRDVDRGCGFAPFVLFQEFCGCRTVEDVGRLAKEEFGEGTTLEFLHVSWIPHLINVIDASVIAEDVRAVLERRGSYRFFEDEATAFAAID